MGDKALHYLIRLWSHCQEEKRGGLWVGATPDYVEAVCQFRGKQGKLYAALLAPLVPTGVGFIEDGTSSGEKLTPFVQIHDWHEENGGLIVSWKNGCKGGRKRTRGLPTDSPTDNPPRADQSRVE